MAYSRTHANRGKQLEKLIDDTNKQYEKLGHASVKKIPTPTKIIKHMGNKFVGHTEKGELVDYMGIGPSRAIIFDAKQTALSSFPLSNVQEHQYQLLKAWHEYGADSFLVVHFSEKDRYYRLPFTALHYARERVSEGGRKSIAFKEFETMAYELRVEKGFGLDYLEGLY